MNAELISTSGARLIRVPPGSFIMGSPPDEQGRKYWEGEREVTFAHEFFLGATPVTQSQYEQVTGNNPTDHPKAGTNAPVDSVNWEMANAFTSKLTIIDRQAGALDDGWVYRLPTEAEWEYACRAGNQEASYGDLDAIAWYLDNAKGRPHAVGQKKPNEWGFHDMLGNVFEWCQDLLYRAGRHRSVRGGCYYSTSLACRAARREGWIPGNRGRYCGIRLLAVPEGPFESTPPLDDFPTPPQQRSLTEALEAKDYSHAEQILSEHPEMLEAMDQIPPALHGCVYANRPEMLEWLLDHGAKIERLEQDYGTTPLQLAVVMRRKKIIQILVDRGADTTGALDAAQRGLAGAFEDDPSLNRQGYAEIIKLLEELDVK